MRDRAVNLSDLELARQLSHDLAPQTSATSRDVEPEQWVRFDAARLGLTPYVAAEDSGATPRPPALSKAPEPEEMDSWEELLGWSLSIWPATAGFVVDSAGFVIATAGAWEFERLEGVGSQLLDVARRAVQIEGAGRTEYLAVQYEAFWLSGLTVWRGSEELLVVAFLGDAPLDESARHGVAKQITWNLQRL